MDNEETLKEKTKKLSVKEGCGYSIMDGFGLRYITPFAIELGASNSAIGFLSSVPGLLGNLTQLRTARTMEKVSRKKIVFISVLLQAILWIPLIGVGALYYFFNLKSGSAALLLIFTYTLLTLSGAFGGPAWNSWMKDIVTSNNGLYFGKRNRIVGAVSLVALLAAGFVLNYFKGIGEVFFGFAILFFIAFVGRSISAYLFTKHYEPNLKNEEGYYFSIIQFIKKMPYNNFGRFVIFTSIMSFATALASPFIAVYVLKDLKLNYVYYTLTIVCNSVFTILFMPLWGKFADKYGNIKSLVIGSYLVPLIPLMYLFSAFVFAWNPRFLLPYLFLIEAISGFAWAGYNLSSANFVYDAVSRQRMALCIAYFGIFNSFFTFIGATIGGFVTSLKFSFFGLNPILFIFLIGGIARLGAAIAISKNIKEVREVNKFKINLKSRIRSLMPSQESAQNTNEVS